MTRSLALAACIVFLAANSAFAGRENYFGNVGPKKGEVAKPATGALPPAIQAGGETFTSATPIPSLPYTDTGNTCGAVNDYFPVCAFNGNSNAPDLVYSYTPTKDECVNIDMCDSFYDTIVHVYDSGLALVDCNDDFCGLQSTLENLTLVGGQTYYIVVDGWSTTCGDYTLNVNLCPPPCSTDCPPDAVAEGEPTCGDLYEDITNGGCNSSPPVFTELECNELGVTVCGTYGTYEAALGATRDTDWYSFTIDKVKNVTMCVCGSAPTQIALLNTTGGCDFIVAECGSEYGDANETVCCSATLAPGTYWMFVGTDGFSGIACGSPYVLTLTGLTCPVVPVESATWSKMKNVYR